MVITLTLSVSGTKSITNTRAGETYLFVRLLPPSLPTFLPPSLTPSLSLSIYPSALFLSLSTPYLYIFPLSLSIYPLSLSIYPLSLYIPPLSIYTPSLSIYPLSLYIPPLSRSLNNNNNNLIKLKDEFILLYILSRKPVSINLVLGILTWY